MSEHPPSTDRPTGPGGSGHPEIDGLAAYAAGDSTVAEGEIVRAHLAGCADCAADIDALERVSGDLAGLSMPTMPDDVAARLTAKLDEARGAASDNAGQRTGLETGTVLPASRARRSGGWATGAAAAAVVALVAAVGLNAITGSSDDKASETTSAKQAPERSERLAVYSSGTNYTAATISGQVRSLLRQPVDSAEAATGGDQFSAASTAAAASSSAAAAQADAGMPAPAATSAAAAAEALPSAAQAAAPAAGAAASEAASSEAASSAPASSAAALEAAPAAGVTAAGAQASSSLAAAAKSSDRTSLSSAPPADLANLRNNPALLAACITSLTDGLAQPIAIDYATYAKDSQSPRQPALAIVLPSDRPGFNDVYVVGGDCGTPAAAGTFLHFAVVPTT